jgi:hypothetical protein
MARKAKKKRTGPHPERVKIKGDWETAVGKALKKERPKAGWPIDSEAKQRRTK